MTVSKQQGRFKVSERFFRDLKPGEGVNLFHNMVVLSAAPDWRVEAINYLAIHPDFEPVPEGNITPCYEAVFDAGSAYPRWEKVVELDFPNAA